MDAYDFVAKTKIFLKFSIENGYKIYIICQPFHGRLHARMSMYLTVALGSQNMPLVQWSTKSGGFEAFQKQL
jgi:hypothetical protein